VTVYYSIGAVLDRVEAAQDGTGLNTLIPVSASAAKAGGNLEDIFHLTGHQKLFDISHQDAAQSLTTLVQNVPLYGINLELALDRLLTARSENQPIEDALRKAYGSEPFPSSLHETRPSATSPTLRHPILGEMPKARLCEIYVAFLKAIASGPGQDFGFESDILGKHPDRFLEHFEGFVTAQGSKIKASILLVFGTRIDHDPARALESYVAAGHKKASKMRVTDPVEMVWAWLEADGNQMRHCRDLDRTLKIEGLPRRPNWIRYDVFSLLEKEAIKQYMAEHYIRSNPAPDALSNAPYLRKAITANAEGKVDETLQQLLSQTLNLESHYSGAAQRFAAAAEQRQKESNNLN
jgi:hypothetical protein